MLKTVFVHGRPSGHPIHDKYAKIVNSDFCFSDHKIRWNDIENVSKLKRTLSWLVCAITFPNRKSYNVFFSEGVREPLIIMKWLGLVRDDQKIIALMANENLYFINTNRYGRLVDFLMRAFLKKCDALICIGKYQTELANKLFPNTKTYTIFNGIPSAQMRLLQNINPDLVSKKILVIANCASISRMYYKGLDLSVETFIYILKVFKDMELHVIGECSKEVIAYCERLIHNEYQNKMFFHGHDNIENHLNNSCLFLQLGRGDSFPTSTIESAAAGVPVFVTEETGTKELLDKIDPFFVTSMNPKEISCKIQKYLKISENEKRIVSAKFKEVSLGYTEENANIFFSNVYTQICIDLKLLRD